jgi:hypothetical protein
VRRIWLIVQDQTYQVEVLSTNVFPGGLTFTPPLRARVSEATAGGMLSQRLSKLEHLDLEMIHYIEQLSGCESKGNIRMFTQSVPLMRDSISELFHGFDKNTAHTIDPHLLPNLKSLIYYATNSIGL